MAELKSISTKVDKKSVTIEVEKITNGFLIIERSEWQDPKKGYQYQTKKTFSESNPLKDVKI